MLAALFVKAQIDNTINGRVEKETNGRTYGSRGKANLIVRLSDAGGTVL